MAARKTSRAGGATYLIGDIGGTNTRLAVRAEGRRAPIAEAVFPSREHKSFEEIAARFLEESGAPAPAAAVFGVAGPVSGGVAAITNLPWRIDERILVRRLRIPRVRLANDLAVIARGCLEVPPASTVLLTPSGPARRGHNLAVIAAGTGLGEARLVWVGDRHVALPTEGGHRDFAARTPVEIDLLRFLTHRYPDHVSYERVLSGNGLGALYDFFAARDGREAPDAVARRLAEGDRNAAIAELGLAGAHRPAAEAVDLFAALYGAEAGNLALGELALGGVFVAGNIARHIVPARRDVFLENFRKKGRFSDELAEVPVAVVTDPFVGLRGALALARELAAQTSSTSGTRSAIRASANGTRYGVSPRSKGRKR
jgi:glucokinase